MPPWKIALAAGCPAAVLLILLLIVIYCLFCCKTAIKHQNLGPSHDSSPYNIHQNHDKVRNKRDPFDSALRRSSKMAGEWRMTYPIRSFDWSEHRGLVAEAVERGWGAFAFTYTCSTCPVPANFWDMCTSCSHKQEFEPDINWEMGSGSEYMQKLRLNPGLVLRKENPIAHVQALQAALPLPGPPLVPRSFPQEGYFEVTILAEGREYNAGASQISLMEIDNAKIFSKRLLSGKNADSMRASSQMHESDEEKLTKETSKGSKLGEVFHNLASHVEFSKLSVRENPSGDNQQILAVGLAQGGAPPFRLPGCDIGSVGFHSNARIYLNGSPETEHEPKLLATRRAWGVVKTTVGCGFDPHSKRILFTVNGESAQELVTSSSEFGNPLYPTVAANYDVTLLVNFGQSPFEYAPANAHRAPDLCFRRPYSRSLKNGSMIDDSEDLFSMGCVDSQWFSGTQSPAGSEDVLHRHVPSEAESDLFEIVLDARVN